MRSTYSCNGSISRGRRRRTPSQSRSDGYPLLFMLCCFLFLVSNPHHATITTVTAWKFRFPGGRKKADAATSTSTSHDVLGGGNKNASMENASAAKGRSPQEQPATAAAATKPDGNNSNGWFSWAVASVAAVADEDVVAEAFHAADAATDAAAATGEHQRKFVPPVVLALDALKMAYQRIKTIVVYKPPVGLVALVAAARLVVSGRIFRFYYQSFGSKEDVEFLQQRQQEQYRKREKHEKHRGRALTLDTDDSSYSAFGGVERIRRRLCWAALSSVQRNNNSKKKNNNNQGQKEGESTEGVLDPQKDLIEAATQALHVSARPTGSRLKFVDEMVEPVARMERAMANYNLSTTFKPKKATGYSSSSGGDDECGISPDQLNQLLAISAMTSQVRITDAMMRVCRDRVLQTAYRLARTVEHWERRVKGTRQMKRIFQQLLRGSIEEDRMRLSLAKAAYTAEVQRLGEITAVLMDRPSEMDETAIIRAVKSTENRNCGGAPHDLYNLVGQQPKRAKARDFVSKWTKPVLSKYSFRWKADGRGLFSIRKYEDKDGYIDGPGALEALLGSGQDDWMDQAQDWTREARNVVCKAVRESLQGSISTGSSSSSSSGEYTEQDFAVLEEQWCSINRSQMDMDNEDHWKSMIHYVDNSPSWRRVGEGRSVKLQDLLGILKYGRRLDFLGIPSSLLYVYAASILHERLIRPHWATIRKEAENLSRKALEILQQRVWVPMKGIYDDIMNRSPRMMSALGLETEETSLDHMLRDLGFGDGTPQTRQEALQKATEQYEQDVSSGLFANFVKGRLVKLLLIQVQQLKVGLLSALDTIDVLLQGNRIFFYVLAAIPAIVIANFGTRYFVRALYNIRAKDVRPVTVVHGEMSNFLSKIENLLLLSDRVDLNVGETKAMPGRTPESGTAEIVSHHWRTKLNPSELGEFTLNMHRYLILLDFSSPPFRAKDCDQIHSSLQQFLGTNGTLKRLDGERQLQWLRRIKQKHQDLVKQL